MPCIWHRIPKGRALSLRLPPTHSKAHLSQVRASGGHYHSSLVIVSSTSSPSSGAWEPSSSEKTKKLHFDTQNFSLLAKSQRLAAKNPTPVAVEKRLGLHHVPQRDPKLPGAEKGPKTQVPPAGFLRSGD